jgi:hypothetical protein
MSRQILSSRCKIDLEESSLGNLASLGEEGVASQRRDETSDETLDMKVAGPSSDF